MIGRARRIVPHLRAGLVPVILAALATGCASPGTATPGASGRSGSLLPPLEETPVPSGSASAPSSSAASSVTSPAASVGAHAALVRIDPSLLDVLPTEVDGNQVSESTDAETSTVGDAAVAQAVGRLAVAFVADPQAQNWAVVTVAGLRPGLWSDAFFRDWRDTYDAGACSQSGGVGGHAQARIGGQEAWIGTCANGLRTYHIHLVEGDLVVSISSLGEARFGEQIIAALDVGAAGTSPSP